MTKKARIELRDRKTINSILRVAQERNIWNFDFGMAIFRFLDKIAVFVLNRDGSACIHGEIGTLRQVSALIAA